jgi:putative acetyltransferase
MKEFEDALIEEDLLIARKKKATLDHYKQITKALISSFKKKRGMALVAVEEDEIIGYISVFRYREKSEHIGDFGIQLAKNYRKQGLGTKLSKIMIRTVQDSLPEIECLQLGVFANNQPALNLYTNLGFEKVCCIPKKYKHHGHYIDEIIMQKWLKLP